MTADLSVELEAVQRRQAAYFRCARPGVLTAADRNLALQYLAFKAVYGEPLTPEDRLIVATRLVSETVVGVWPDLFDALCWELGHGFSPRVADALDAMVQS